MIAKLSVNDIETILSIINDAAAAYKGVIPAECWHEPYMSAAELKKDIDAGVEFYGWREGNDLTGVMGIQVFPDVTLIRHAYVLSSEQGKGIGGELLSYLLKKINMPVLIGTWRDTPWSIGLYKKNGFKVLNREETQQLLAKYWTASDVHKANSVVLADRKWLTTKGLEGIEITQAGPEDLSEILVLQKLAYRENGERYNDPSIQPLSQTIEELRQECLKAVALKAQSAYGIVGSIRAYLENDTCYINKVIVHPDYQNRGLGAKLMSAAEKEFARALRYELFTGYKDLKNQYFYGKLGYKVFREAEQSGGIKMLFMEKMNGK